MQVHSALLDQWPHGLGTFATYAEAWIEYRFGWDIPRGFTKFADPPAFGIALDPGACSGVNLSFERRF